ncbi:hypothetical protein CHUAL_005055 [Chamberlinius hualienensis]
MYSSKTSTLFSIAYFILVIIMTKFAFSLTLYHCNNTMTKPNIYFIETKRSKGYLTSLESCSVESAARLHAENQIIIYKTDNVYDEDNPYIRMLRANFMNIKVVVADLDQLFSSTPLMVWHERNPLVDSVHPEVHLADAIRIALLWKYGGIYLDTDIIVIKSLKNLKNSVGVEYGKVLNDPVLGIKYGMRVNNAVLVLDKDLPFIYQYMQRFASDFNSQLFSYHGPVMMTKMLKEMCGVEKMDELINDNRCMGIWVLPKNAFYPVDYLSTVKYYSPVKNFDIDISQSFTLHINRHGVNGSHSTAAENSLINQIAKEFCPLTQQIMFRDGQMKDLLQ